MLSGTYPFNGTTRPEIFKRIKLGKFDMPETFSKDLKDLIKKMLESDPKKRITAEGIL
jgi:serine/threonine protein kinase